MDVLGSTHTTPGESTRTTMMTTTPSTTLSVTSHSSYTPDDVSSTQDSPMTSFYAVTTEDDDGLLSAAGETWGMGNGSSLGEWDVDWFLQQKNDEFTMLVLPAMVFLGVLFVVGVAGNSVVLYVYNQKFQKGTIRWFVQALAIFDLLSCLVAIPGETIDMRNNYTFGSSPMCKVLRTVSMFCTVASGMTLMVVAVERYKRICTPLRKQITPKGAKGIIAVCAVTASVVAAPACVIYGPQSIPTDDPRINGSDCSTADAFMGTLAPLAFSAFQFLLFFLGALALIVLYSLIGRKVWSHENFRRSGFHAGINRRMSFFFTGSECSSPTTEDLVFAFPDKRSSAVAGTAAATEAVEENSNSSQGNNDTNDNINVNDNTNDNINDNTNDNINYTINISPQGNDDTKDGNVHPESEPGTNNNAVKGHRDTNHNNNIHPSDDEDNKDNNNILVKKEGLASTERSHPRPSSPHHLSGVEISPPAGDDPASEDVRKPYRAADQPLTADTKTPADEDPERSSSEGPASSEPEDHLSRELAEMFDDKLSLEPQRTNAADPTKSLDGRAASSKRPQTLGKELAKRLDRQVSWEVGEKPSKGSTDNVHQRKSSEEEEGEEQNGETPTPASPPNPNAVSKSVDRQASSDQQQKQPPSPSSLSISSTFPPIMDTFRRPRLTSRQTSRDRVKSGDSTRSGGGGGRYRRRSVQHTKADMRRFLHRSESVTSGTRRTTLMLFLITMVYLLSFLPYLVLMILKVLDQASLSGGGDAWELAHNILLRSYFINSMANPVIYSFCSRTFRKECSKLLHYCRPCCCCCCSRSSGAKRQCKWPCKCRSPTLFVY